MARCFVIQGFGKKTDFTDGRVLDLDASYAVIKEAVEAVGFECLRADEIVHSGTIDQPMYEHLLRADLVIADLSTQNINAAFELGVRYGLRPRATIIVAEEGFKQAFDVSHLMIRRYKHLGEDIGRKEAARFQKELQDAMTEIVAGERVDSPVYTFLNQLSPPRECTAPQPAAADAAAVAPAAPSQHGAESPTAAESQTTKVLLEVALAWMAAGQPSDFVGATQLLETVRERRPYDHFVVHQLALATYKSELPTPLAALQAARDILTPLHPLTTNDPETLGLWGAIHRRLWDLEGRPEHLSESITAYLRGFALKQDYNNGINLAMLLEVRSLQSARAGERDEAIADRVFARRVRHEVLHYLEPQLDDVAELRAEQRYWVLAALWQVNAGLGHDSDANVWEQKARAAKPTDAMIRKTQEYLERVRRIQADLAAALAAPG
jgi:hypothetical protein